MQINLYSLRLIEILHYLCSVKFHNTKTIVEESRKEMCGLLKRFYRCNLWLVLTALVLLTGCGRQGRQDGNNDSTAVEQVPIEQLMLPDTMYASADVVKYVVENTDSVDTPLRDLDDRYADSSRVMTFRKNLMRNADFGGRVQGTPTTIETVWEFTTDRDTTHTSHGVWGGGTGWTGQPLYARWTDEEMQAFRSSGALTADFGREEVFVASLCGKGYFLNFETGKLSRQKLDLGNVIKGTPSLDPELMNLYVGQGVARKGGVMGCEAFDLLKHQRTFYFGPDPKAWRNWGAFDSSPVVVGGYLFWPGENGTLYKYERRQGELRRVSVMRYRVRGVAPGIESCLCVYRNYGFFCDNHGNVICVNLNTMRPVWHYDNHDDSDGTVVCREESGVPYVYTACEVDRQGEQGICYFVKLNGLNGSRVWERQIPCKRVELTGKSLDGGIYSTPLLGLGDCADMVFVNLCRNGADHVMGQLMALNTADGAIRYTVNYREFAWSSPIPFLNEKSELFVMACDAAGNIRLVQGKTGRVLCQTCMGSNFESSPIAVGNTAVVGCRGGKIYKFAIK